MNLRAASLSDSLVEPNSHGPFVICEEPAAKAAKKPTVFLTVRLAALPDEGLLKP